MIGLLRVNKLLFIIALFAGISACGGNSLPAASQVIAPDAPNEVILQRELVDPTPLDNNEFGN